MRKEVAIISSFYHNWNYGGLLQAYALNSTISSMGFKPSHIPIDFKYDYNYQSLRSAVVKRIRRIKVVNDSLDYYHGVLVDNHKKEKAFRDFHNHMILSKEILCYNANNIHRLNNCYDYYIAGSDQIWNPVFLPDEKVKMFGLTFVHPSKRTISYAASIGSERAAVGKENMFREILSGLDYISVREQAAKDFLQPLTDKHIKVVQDPTLLLTQEQWRMILSRKRETTKYVFSYFLKEESNSHAYQLWKIAGQLPIWCISDENGRYCRDQDHQILDAGPIEFLDYIANAEIVITNSFHGMVFSLIFQKSFWVMKRFKDTDEVSMNNRIMYFLREFDLEDRLLEDGELPDEERLCRSIDYNRVGKILEQKRTESLQWLANALAGK